jgi:hypothetical protein
MKIRIKFTKGQYPDREEVDITLEGPREELSELAKIIALHMKSIGWSE